MSKKSDVGFKFLKPLGFRIDTLAASSFVPRGDEREACLNILKDTNIFCQALAHVIIINTQLNFEAENFIC